MVSLETISSLSPASTDWVGDGAQTMVSSREKALVSSHVKLGALGLIASPCHETSCEYKKSSITKVNSHRISRPLETQPIVILQQASMSFKDNTRDEGKHAAENKPQRFCRDFSHHRHVWHGGRKHLAAYYSSPFSSGGLAP